MILLFVGMNLDKSNVYQSREEKLEQFEKNIQNEQIVNEEKAHITFNQVKENHAGNLAKNTSVVIKSITKGVVTIFHSIFEDISET